MNSVLWIVECQGRDASKLFVACLAKEPVRTTGLEGRGRVEARLRDSIVAGLQIEG